MLLVFGCNDYGNVYFYRMRIWISYGNWCLYLITKSPNSRVRIRSYCAFYSRRGQRLSGKTCPTCVIFLFPQVSFCNRPPAPPRWQTAETMHPCHDIRGCPWHGVGGTGEGTWLGQEGTWAGTGPGRDSCHPCPIFHPHDCLVFIHQTFE
jgi:hypothetical protein